MNNKVQPVKILQKKMIKIMIMKTS